MPDMDVHACYIVGLREVNLRNLLANSLTQRASFWFSEDPLKQYRKKPKFPLASIYIHIHIYICIYMEARYIFTST